MSTFPTYLLLLLIVASSCKAEWSESEKKAFMDRCMAPSTYYGQPETQDSSVCDCLLKKTMEKSPDPSDTVHITYQERIEWGAKCQGFE